jgi:transcriptional regulator with GAF, ATPase, and Fis domain
MTTAEGAGAGSALAEVARAVERLCRQCVQAASVDGAGVTLMSDEPSGPPALATICATDATSSRLEELQFVLGEGPCMDAVARRAPVMVSDLAERCPDVQARWPGFLAEASQAGAQAVFSFPLQVGDVVLGAMDLYRTTPGELGAGQASAAAITAGAAALLLLEAVGLRGPVEDDEQSRTAYRLEVHAAAGMVSVQLGTTIASALLAVRSAAFAQDRSVDAVAADVVARRIRFPEEGA